MTRLEIADMMTEQEFDNRAERINATHEKAWAKLFNDARSDAAGRRFWTQERIAGKIGKTPQFVSYSLRFGAFLEYSTMVENVQIPNNLTERKFREYWERSEGRTEHIRFGKVCDMIRDNTKVGWKANRDIGPTIRELFAGKGWKTTEQIYDAVNSMFDKEILENQVVDCLDRMRKDFTHDCVAECKEYIKTPSGKKWKIKKIKPEQAKVNAIRLNQQAETLYMLIEEGIRLSDRHSAECSPVMILGVFSRMRDILKPLVDSMKSKPAGKESA